MATCTRRGAPRGAGRGAAARGADDERSQGGKRLYVTFDDPARAPHEICTTYNVYKADYPCFWDCDICPYKVPNRRRATDVDDADDDGATQLALRVAPPGTL